MEEEVINKVCEERGHITTGGYTSTAMYSHPEIEETECHTATIYHGCNIIRYRCDRCGEIIKEKEKTRKVYNWKSEECKHN